MSQAINLPSPQSPPLPAISVTAVLDGVSYTLQMVWNDRDQGWYLRVLDELGQTILMGDVRMSAGVYNNVALWPLYRGRVKRSPPGLLGVRDSSGQGVDPTQASLGAQHGLEYMTAAEALTLGYA